MASVQRLRKDYQRWYYIFVGLNVLILFLAIVADPYRLVPVHVTISGINDVKPRLYDYQRYVKLFDIAYQKPKTVLLGSSRVLWGLDPKNPLLNEYQPVYNAGIMGPPVYEIKHYFDHALANQPNLKRVILALDFYSFNAKFDNREFELMPVFGKQWREIITIRKDLLFDIKAVAETLWSSATRKDVMTLRRDGRLAPDPLTDRVLYQSFFGVEPTIKSKKQAKKQLAMRSELYHPFKLSKQDFDALRYMVKTCKERNIELIIYIAPTLQSSEIGIFHDYGIWQDYKTYQKELAKLHPFWDFTGWNSITMNKDNFVDGSHHIFPVGDIVLARMLGAASKDVPKSFGRYVTASTVENHLRDINHEYLMKRT
jgi:hypothetical protein